MPQFLTELTHLRPPKTLHGSYFASTLAAEIAAAKAEGRFSEGVSDLSGSSITIKGQPKVRARGAADSRVSVLPLLAACFHVEAVRQVTCSAATPTLPPPSSRVQVLWSEPGAATAAQRTLVHTLLVDRGVSFPEALRRLAHEQMPGDDSGFRRSRRPMFGAHLVMLAIQKPGQKNVYSLVRPNTGARRRSYEGFGGMGHWRWRVRQRCCWAAAGARCTQI